MSECLVMNNMFYEGPGNFMPTLRNIRVENRDIKKGEDVGIYVLTYKASPVENLRVVNCTICGVKTPMQIDHVKNFILENVVISGKLAEVPLSIAEKQAVHQSPICLLKI